MKEATTSGQLILLLSLSDYPDGENFDYIDYSDSDFHEFHLIWDTPRSEKTYFIAVTKNPVAVTPIVEFSITGRFHTLMFIS